MNKIWKFLKGFCLGVAIIVAIKLVAEACSPCMQKYFEVEKD